MKTRYLGAICLAICMALFIAGLWSFNFWPLNKAERLQNENGIRFYGQGIVFGPEPLLIRKTPSGSGSISIELLIRPHKESSNAVAAILTLYDRDREQFIFSQWKTHLLIRIPAASPNSQKKYREIGITGALKRDTTHLITVASGKETTDIFVDGKHTKRFPHYSLIPLDQGLSGHLVLGNSPVGTHPWNGSIFGLAIYDRILNDKEALDRYHAWQKRGQPHLAGEKKPLVFYLFDEQGGARVRNHAGSRNHLLIPAIFQPFHRTILGVPTKDHWFSRSNAEDIAVNIFGFMPFGFFLPAWLRLAKNLPAPRVYGITILLGFSISLAIELTQAYLPMRDSSLIDVVNNTLGAAAGVVLFKYALPTLHKVKGERTDLI